MARFGWLRRKSRPLLSFVVIAYDMQREVSRTVRSLARDYQRGAGGIDYEVVVVDNASPEPLDLSEVGDIGVPLRLFRRSREEASVSPADAVNFGVRHTRGEYVAVMIDGARMLTPGVVQGAAQALRLARQPVVAVLGLHLGPEHQRRSVERGYSKAVEDRLLEAIRWPEDGYRLFQIGSWGGSCPGGWLTRASESNCIVLSRALFAELGGFDEGFAMPGGGLVNLDFYKRAAEHSDSTLIYLAGEGCFHQLHGGVTTGKRAQGHTFDELNEEYRKLRGEPFRKPDVQPLLHGSLAPLHTPAFQLAVDGVHKFDHYPSVAEFCEPFLAEGARAQAGESTTNESQA